MTEGLDNLAEFGAQISLHIGEEASDIVRSMAVFENTSPYEILRTAIALYNQHLRMMREGWDGPIYSRPIQQPNGLEAPEAASKESVKLVLPEKED